MVHIILPFVGVYKKYILFTFSFIAIELIIFILAILFVRSLEKLNYLANEYGHGRFTSQIKLSKNSSLSSLYKSLKIMANKINNLMSSQKDLINSVSHELRTPISRIRFSLELMIAAKNTKELKKRTSEIEEDIYELESLVSEILSYAQLERSETTNKLEKIYIKQLLDIVITQFKKSFPDKQLILNISSNVDNVTIMANKKYVIRALQNLLQNAGKFSASTVKLTFINHSLTDYQLNIEDDGLGIPSEDRVKIFEPFFQLNNHPENISRGYGFGLAITKKIIDQYKWKIVIEDSDLGGAKIIIHICKHASD